MGLSLDQKTHSYHEINKHANYIFICVPTPFDFKKKKIDLNALNSVLRNFEKDKVVIIKSTIPPGTTKELEQKYPHLILLFNPEFLSAKKAVVEFEYPDRQLVGYTDKSFRYAMDILNLLP